MLLANAMQQQIKLRSINCVVSNQRINEYLKLKLYDSVVCTALYDSECYLTAKENECRLILLEMKMLFSISGVTLYDHIQNKKILDHYDVVPIPHPMKNCRRGTMVRSYNSC